MQKLRPSAEILKRVLREQVRHPCQVSQSEENSQEIVKEAKEKGVPEVCLQ